jgi:hypothetical protein
MAPIRSRISRRFVRRVALNVPMPVMFPPGRLRLGTRPRRTGSLAAENTIGMVEVAGFGGMRRGWASRREQHSHTQGDEIGSKRGQSVVTTFCPTESDRQILSFDEPRFAQPLAERCDHGGGLGR